MNITDIRVRRVWKSESLRALVSITIDNDLAIHDIKIIEGSGRLFVAMPSRKDGNGVYRDIAHPISHDAREMLESKLLCAYHEYIAQNELDE